MHLVFTHSRQVCEPQKGFYNNPSPAASMGEGVGIQDIYSGLLIIHVDHVSHVTDLFKNQCRFNLIVFAHKFKYMAWTAVLNIPQT